MQLCLPFIKADELIITVNNYGIDSKKVVAFQHGQIYDLVIDLLCTD